MFFITAIPAPTAYICNNKETYLKYENKSTMKSTITNTTIHSIQSLSRAVIIIDVTDV